MATKWLKQIQEALDQGIHRSLPHNTSVKEWEKFQLFSKVVCNRGNLHFDTNLLGDCMLSFRQPLSIRDVFTAWLLMIRFGCETKYTFILSQPRQVTRTLRKPPSTYLTYFAILNSHSTKTALECPVWISNLFCNLWNILLVLTMTMKASRTF